MPSRGISRTARNGAREDVVIRQSGHDLFGSQAFGNSDGVLHHLAFDDGADDIAQTGVLLKQVLAGLEFRTRLQGKYGADERPPVAIDHAFTLERIGYVGHSGSGRSIDHLFFLQRAGSFNLLSAVNVRATDTDHDQQHKGEHGVANHHPRVAGPLRSFWRRRNLLRLQRGARAAWRNGRPLTHRCNLRSCRCNRGQRGCRNDL